MKRRYQKKYISGTLIAIGIVFIMLDSNFINNVKAQEPMIEEDFTIVVLEEEVVDLDYLVAKYDTPEYGHAITYNEVEGRYETISGEGILVEGTLVLSNVIIALDSEIVVIGEIAAESSTMEPLVEGTTWVGLSINGGKGTISDCTFDSADIGINGYIAELAVSDSHFIDCREGIHIERSTNVDIFSNTFEGCTESIVLNDNPMTGPVTDPDFEPTITTSDPTPGQGSIITISLIVKNWGTTFQSIEPLDIYLYDSTSGTDVEVEHYTATRVIAGRSITQTYFLDTTSLTPGGYTYKVSVDPADEVVEESELNNEVTVSITVVVPPTVTVSYDDTSDYYSGDTVDFDVDYSDSDGTVDQVRIEYGDGAWDEITPVVSSGTHIFSYAYSEDDTYDVEVYALDDSGIISQDSISILILNQIPVANSITINTVPPYITFDPVEFSADVDDDDPLTYYWSFTSSDTGTQYYNATENPITWSFGRACQYTVAMYAEDDVAEQSNTVTTLIDIDNRPPVASATIFALATGEYPTFIQTGEDIVFEDTSLDFDSLITFWEWDFDSDTSIDWSSTTGGTVTYAYTEAGIYSPTLIVTDEFFDTDSFTGDPITVETPPAPVSIEVVGHEGEDPVSIFANDELTFVAQYPPEVIPTAINWDVDNSDGIQLDAQGSPVMWMYSIPGTYIVTMDIYDASGLVGSDTITIDVAVMPMTVEANAQYTDLAVNYEMWFEGTVVDGPPTISNYAWDYDGDDIIDWSSPTNDISYWEYTTSGTYEAKFIVTDSGTDHADTITINVYSQIRVYGTVTDESFVPIPYATVDMLDPVTLEIMDSVLTDINGEYELYPPQASDYPLDVMADNYDPLQTSTGLLTWGDDIQLDHVLTSSPQVTLYADDIPVTLNIPVGHPTDVVLRADDYFHPSGGYPVAYMFETSDSWTWEESEGEPGFDGICQHGFDTSTDATYTATVMVQSNLGDVCQSEVEIIVGTGGSGSRGWWIFNEVELHLTEDGSTPIDDAFIRVYDSNGNFRWRIDWTDENGDADFWLRDGDYKLRINYAQYNFWTDVFTVSDDMTYDWQIPHADYEVTVVAGGFELQNVVVRAFKANGRNIRMLETTDENGVATFHLPAGKDYKFRVRISGDNYWSDVTDGDPVTIDVDTIPVDVTIETDESMDNVLIEVYNRWGGYTGIFTTTSAPGITTMNVPDTRLIYKVHYLGYSFSSNPRRGDVTITIPSDTRTVEVTVNGVQGSDFEVFVDNEDHVYTGLSRMTVGGETTFELPTGYGYYFRVVVGSEVYTSELNTAGTSTIDVSGMIEHTVHTNYDSSAIDVTVEVYDGMGKVGEFDTTSGVGSISMMPGTYDFRFLYLGHEWSSGFTTSTDVTMDVPVRDVDITVTCPGFTLEDIEVSLWTTADPPVHVIDLGTTDTGLVLTVDIPDTVDYRIRAFYQGQFYDDDISGTDTTASIEIPLWEVTVTVTGDYSSNAIQGATVEVIDGVATIDMDTTDASGQVTFLVPTGMELDYRVTYYEQTSTPVTSSASTVSVVLDVEQVLVNVQTDGPSGVTDLDGYQVRIFYDGGVVLTPVDTISGVATFEDLPAGATFSFEVTYLGVNYNSGDQTITTALTVDIIITESEINVTVTFNGEVVEGAVVSVYSDEGVLIASIPTETTDIDGIATFVLPDYRNYIYKTTYLGYEPETDPASGDVQFVIENGYVTARAYYGSGSYEGTLYLLKEDTTDTGFTVVTDENGLSDTFACPTGGSYILRMEYAVGETYDSDPFTLEMGEYIDVNVGLLCDLTVTDLDVDPAFVMQDGDVHITYDISNVGAATVSTCDVFVYYDRPGNEITSFTIEDLDLNPIQSFDHTWKVPGCNADHTVYVVVDFDDELAESDEENNQLAFDVHTMGIHISQNTISGGDVGINVIDTDCQIDENTVSSTAVAGVKVDSINYIGTLKAEVLSNTISETVTGIQFDNYATVYVESNTISNVETAILINDGAGSVTGNIISDVTTGIQISNSNAAIASNTIDTATVGVTVTTQGGDITDNVLTQVDTGIDLTDSIKTISGNQITSYVTVMNLDTYSGTIEQNTIDVISGDGFDMIDSEPLIFNNTLNVRSDTIQGGMSLVDDIVYLDGIEEDSGTLTLDREYLAEEFNLGWDNNWNIALTNSQAQSLPDQYTPESGDDLVVICPDVPGAGSANVWREFTEQEFGGKMSTRFKGWSDYSIINDPNQVCEVTFYVPGESTTYEIVYSFVDNHEQHPNAYPVELETALMPSTDWAAYYDDTADTLYYFYTGEEHGSVEIIADDMSVWFEERFIAAGDVFTPSASAMMRVDFDVSTNPISSTDQQSRIICDHIRLWGSYSTAGDALTTTFSLEPEETWTTLDLTFTQPEGTSFSYDVRDEYGVPYDGFTGLQEAQVDISAIGNSNITIMFYMTGNGETTPILAGYALIHTGYCDNAFICDNSDPTIKECSVDFAVEEFLEAKQDSDVLLIDTPFMEGSIDVQDITSKATVNWYLTVELIDTDYEPVDGITVDVTDQLLNTVSDVTVDGATGQFELTSVVIYDTSRTYYTPHNIETDLNDIHYSVLASGSCTLVYGLDSDNDYAPDSEESSPDAIWYQAEDLVLDAQSNEIELLEDMTVKVPAPASGYLVLRARGDGDIDISIADGEGSGTVQSFLVDDDRKWFTTSEFTSTAGYITITFSGSDAALDKFAVVDSAIVGAVSDPLSFDTDGDMLFDGFEQQASTQWFEGENNPNPGFSPLVVIDDDSSSSRYIKATGTDQQIILQTINGLDISATYRYSARMKAVPVVYDDFTQDNVLQGENLWLPDDFGDGYYQVAGGDLILGGSELSHSRVMMNHQNGMTYSTDAVYELDLEVGAYSGPSTLVQIDVYSDSALSGSESDQLLFTNGGDLEISALETGMTLRMECDGGLIRFYVDGELFKVGEMPGATYTQLSITVGTLEQTDTIELFVSEARVADLGAQAQIGVVGVGVNNPYLTYEYEWYSYDFVPVTTGNTGLWINDLSPQGPKPSFNGVVAVDRMVLQRVDEFEKDESFTITSGNYTSEEYTYTMTVPVGAVVTSAQMEVEGVHAAGHISAATPTANGICTDGEYFVWVGTDNIGGTDVTRVKYVHEEDLSTVYYADNSGDDTVNQYSPRLRDGYLVYVQDNDGLSYVRMRDIEASTSATLGSCDIDSTPDVSSSVVVWEHGEVLKYVSLVDDTDLNGVPDWQQAAPVGSIELGADHVKNPRVDEDKVVWEYEGFDAIGLAVFTVSADAFNDNMPSEESFGIQPKVTHTLYSSSNTILDTCISGNRIVLFEDTGSDYEIRVFDITTMHSEVIVNVPSFSSHLTIEGERVVWFESGNPWHVKMYDLNSLTTRILLSGTFPPTLFDDLDYQSGTLLWMLSSGTPSLGFSYNDYSASIGTEDIWSYGCVFSGPVTTPDFTGAVNAYLETATDGNGDGLIDVPITFHSDYDLQLAIDSLRFEYDFESCVLCADTDGDEIEDGHEYFDSYGCDILEFEDSIRYRDWVNPNLDINEDDQSTMQDRILENSEFFYQTSVTLSASYKYVQNDGYRDSYVVLDFTPDVSGDYTFILNPDYEEPDTISYETQQVMDRYQCQVGDAQYMPIEVLSSMDVDLTQEQMIYLKQVMESATYVTVEDSSGTTVGAESETERVMLERIQVGKTIQNVPLWMGWEELEKHTLKVDTHLGYEGSYKLVGRRSYQIMVGLDLSLIPLNLQTDEQSGVGDGVDVPAELPWDWVGLARTMDLDRMRVERTTLNAMDADSDDDGLRDGFEAGSNTMYPLNPDADSDGLTDRLELEVYGTNLGYRDSDYDGIRDAVELGFHPDMITNLGGDISSPGSFIERLAHNGNPFDFTPVDNWDHDWADEFGDPVTYDPDLSVATTDPLDTDTDNDGLPDGWADGWNYMPGTNPTGLRTFQVNDQRYKEASFWRYDERYWKNTGDKDNRIQVYEGEDLDLDGSTGTSASAWSFNDFTYEIDPDVMQTDASQADSDSDGIPDGYEVFYSVLPPVKGLDDQYVLDPTLDDGGRDADYMTADTPFMSLDNAPVADTINDQYAIAQRLHLPGSASNYGKISKIEVYLDPMENNVISMEIWSGKIDATLGPMPMTYIAGIPNYKLNGPGWYSYEIPDGTFGTQVNTDPNFLYSEIYFIVLRSESEFMYDIAEPYNLPCSSALFTAYSMFEFDSTMVWVPIADTPPLHNTQYEYLGGTCNMREALNYKLYSDDYAMMGDGLTNLQEYIAGTNPKVSDSDFLDLEGRYDDTLSDAQEVFSSIMWSDLHSATSGYLTSLTDTEFGVSIDSFTGTTDTLVAIGDEITFEFTGHSGERVNIQMSAFSTLSEDFDVLVGTNTLSLTDIDDVTATTGGTDGRFYVYGIEATGDSFYVRLSKKNGGNAIGFDDMRFFSSTGGTILRTSFADGAISFSGYGATGTKIYYDGDASADGLEAKEYSYDITVTEPQVNIDDPFAGMDDTNIQIAVLVDGSKLLMSPDNEYIYVWDPATDFSDTYEDAFGNEYLLHTCHVYYLTGAASGFDHFPAEVGREIYISNPFDLDTDDDGIYDGLEINWNLNSDEDWVPNVRDPDSDNDGLIDGNEVMWDSYEDYSSYPEYAIFLPTGYDSANMINPDSDHDGIPDGNELDFDYDTDGDGLVNMLDPDSDNDGLVDGWVDGIIWDPKGNSNQGAYIQFFEAGPSNDFIDNYDGYPLSSDDETIGGFDIWEGEDVDQDAIVDDSLEGSPIIYDTDGDGLKDGFDLYANPGSRTNTPIQYGELYHPNMPFSGADQPRPQQSESTSPALADTDEDGLDDLDEILGYSFDWEDFTDPATGGDATTTTVTVTTDPNDPDADGDGLVDGKEYMFTHPQNADTDGDNLPDGLEDSNHNGKHDTDETNPADQDTDNDHLPDGYIDTNMNDVFDPDLEYGEDIDLDGEVDRAFETDPVKRDSDLDNVHDGQEFYYLRSHTSYYNYDSDNDGVIDLWQIDSDKDGLSDGQENRNHDTSYDAKESDATNPDTDGDGLYDSVEPFWYTDMDGDTFINARDSNSNGMSTGTDYTRTYVVFRTNAPRYSDTHYFSMPGTTVEVDVRTDGTTPSLDGTSPDLDLNVYTYVATYDDTEFDWSTVTVATVEYKSEPVDITTPDGMRVGYFTAESFVFVVIEDQVEIGYHQYETQYHVFVYDSTASDNGIYSDTEFVYQKQETYDYRKYLDMDDDNDGINNNIENSFGTLPDDPDSDDDGIIDGLEKDWNVVNTVHGLINALDPDSDGDGLFDGWDDVNGNGKWDAGEEPGEDINGNGKVDVGETDPYDDDTDNDLVDDGTEDVNANRIVDSGETDPLDADTDDDGMTDGYELQTDFDDGIVGIQTCDPTLLDTDGDGIQDGTEWGIVEPHADTEGSVFIPDSFHLDTTNPVNDDSDDDDLTDGVEDKNKNGMVDTGETDPNKDDTDGDTILDGEEVIEGVDGYITDPLNMDTDSDGIDDGVELSSSNGYVTDPSNPDTDGDGASDSDEINGWQIQVYYEYTFENKDESPRTVTSNPLVENTDYDLEHAHQIEGEEHYLLDGEEMMLGGDPNALDTDGDNIPDHLEALYGSTLEGIEASPPQFKDTPVIEKSYGIKEKKWHGIPYAVLAVTVDVSFEAEDVTGIEKIEVEVSGHDKNSYEVVYGDTFDHSFSWDLDADTIVSDFWSGWDIAIEVVDNGNVKADTQEHLDSVVESLYVNLQNSVDVILNSGETIKKHIDIYITRLTKFIMRDIIDQISSGSITSLDGILDRFYPLITGDIESFFDIQGLERYWDTIDNYMKMVPDSLGFVISSLVSSFKDADEFLVEYISNSAKLYAIPIFEPFVNIVTTISQLGFDFFDIRFDILFSPIIIFIESVLDLIENALDFFKDILYWINEIFIEGILIRAIKFITDSLNLDKDIELPSITELVEYIIGKVRLLIGKIKTNSIIPPDELILDLFDLSSYFGFHELDEAFNVFRDTIQVYPEFPNNKNVLITQDKNGDWEKETGHQDYGIILCTDQEWYDTEVFRSVFKHYSIENTIILDGEQATYNAFVRILKQLELVLDSQDSLYIIIGSHGYKGGILMNDGHPMHYSELDHLLDQIEAKEVLVSIDACYSGSALPYLSEQLHERSVIVSCGQDELSTGRFQFALGMKLLECNIGSLYSKMNSYYQNETSNLNQIDTIDSSLINGVSNSGVGGLIVSSGFVNRLVGYDDAVIAATLTELGKDAVTIAEVILIIYIAYLVIDNPSILDEKITTIKLPSIGDVNLNNGYHKGEHSGYGLTHILEQNLGLTKEDVVEILKKQRDNLGEAWYTKVRSDGRRGGWFIWAKFDGVYHCCIISSSKLNIGYVTYIPADRFYIHFNCGKLKEFNQCVFPDKYRTEPIT